MEKRSRDRGGEGSKEEYLFLSVAVYNSLGTKQRIFRNIPQRCCGETAVAKQRRMEELGLPLY